MFEYHVEYAKVERKVKELTKKENIVSLLRVAFFLLSFCLFAIGFADHKNWAVGVGALVLLVFIANVIWFVKIREQVKYWECYSEVLNRYVERFTNDWMQFEDTGKEYLDTLEESKVHGAVDLDILGEASLFQFTNVATSKNGKDQLVKRLVVGLGQDVDCQDIDTLSKYQEAVAELQGKNEFSLHMEALLRMAKKQYGKDLDYVDTETLTAEDYEKGKASSSAYGVVIMAGISVAAMIVSLILGVFGVISYKIFAGVLVFQFVASQLLDGILFSKSQDIFMWIRFFAAYDQFLQSFSKESFACEYLKHLQDHFAKDSQKGMERLSMVGALLQIRYNPLVYTMLCIICFYNVFAYGAYIWWKHAYEDRLPVWLGSLGELEAMLSLSVIGRCRSNARMPRVEASKVPTIIMGNMRHPLIMEKDAVGNDVVMHNQMRVITGSNMSGKTTYLRSIGANMVLAYAGAAVCCDTCKLSPMRIFTSMRVVDDVSHGISTFYAEVLRIKEMVAYSQNQIPMLVLIDEIFKGTNSADRIVGARTVINQLCLGWVNGLVSTHDFELCALKDKQDMIENYHFDEYFEEDQLKFEYKIKEGRCETTNALFILKMAGIEGVETK